MDPLAAKRDPTHKATLRDDLARYRSLPRPNTPLRDVDHSFCICRVSQSSALEEEAT